jgi:predicted nuclease of predicted toxin-antitoxin system
LKLLVDEMYPPVIAGRLRATGHDAVSAIEQAGLVGADDLQVWRFAVEHRRAIVTENAADFLAISKQACSIGDAASSLVITSNRSFPRHPRSFVGRAVRALAAFCDEHPDDDQQAGAVYWLRPLA